MSFPDKTFPWVWTAFILAFIVAFSIIEGLALAWGDTTLSRFVWELSLAWPPLQFVIGGVTCGLAVHFFWHWSPPGSKSEGG